MGQHEEHDERKRGVGPVNETRGREVCRSAYKPVRPKAMVEFQTGAGWDLPPHMGVTGPGDNS